MRSVLVAGFVIALAGPALAQEGPKRVKTEIVRESPLGMSTLYKIDDDGTVRIDWATVETLAITKADRNVLPIAQLMLSIRDGTWKPVRYLCAKDQRARTRAGGGTVGLP